MRSNLVIVRGGGDLATGVIHKLHRCGFNVIILETNSPTVVRRTVAFAQAVFDDACEVEGVKAQKISDTNAFVENLEKYNFDRSPIPLLIDPNGTSIASLKPEIVVDAIVAKTKTSTTKDLAPIVVALGPGHVAGVDAHAVIETNRGHNLGRVILSGSAANNTGVPGDIDGFTYQRVIRAPKDGVIRHKVKICDRVEEGEIISYVDDQPIYAPLTGIIRGLIAEGLNVKKNMKVGDIDPRDKLDHCFTISDKARAIAGGVLEAILYLRRNS